MSRVLGRYRNKEIFVPHAPEIFVETGTRNASAAERTRPTLRRVRLMGRFDSWGKHAVRDTEGLYAKLRSAKDKSSETGPEETQIRRAGRCPPLLCGCSADGPQHGVQFRHPLRHDQGGVALKKPLGRLGQYRKGDAHRPQIHGGKADVIGRIEDELNVIQAGFSALADLRKCSEATPRGVERPGNGQPAQEGRNTPQLRVLTQVQAGKMQRMRSFGYHLRDTANEVHEVEVPREIHQHPGVITRCLNHFALPGAQHIIGSSGFASACWTAEPPTPTGSAPNPETGGRCRTGRP